MPDYYHGKEGMEPFDVIDAFGLDFYEGNVIKYIVRWRKKDGLEDLYKARHYVDAIIKRAKEDEQCLEDNRLQTDLPSLTRTDTITPRSMASSEQPTYS